MTVDGNTLDFDNLSENHYLWYRKDGGDDARHADLLEFIERVTEALRERKE